jgi:glycosyltransferase 2 family protein
VPSSPLDRPTHRTRRLVWGFVRFAIGIGLLIYLAKSGIVDLETLKRLVGSWRVSLAAVALMGADVLMMSLRLCWLLRPHGLNLPLGKSLQLTFVSFFFTTFLPGSSGGVLAKLFYAAKDNEGRRTEIATVVIFDRAIGLFSLLLLSLFFVPVFPHMIWSVTDLRFLVLIVGVLAVGLLVALAVVMLRESAAHRLLRRMLAWLPWKDMPSRAIDTISVYRRSPGTLLAAFGVSVLANFCVVCVAALALFALEPASFSFRALLVAPLGYIANSLPLTPGGLGVGEEAFNSLFKLMGLTGGADVLLSWRIWSLPISIVGLALYLRGLGQSVNNQESARAPYGRT